MVSPHHFPRLEANELGTFIVAEVHWRNDKWANWKWVLRVWNGRGFAFHLSQVPSLGYHPKKVCAHVCPSPMVKRWETWSTFGWKWCHYRCETPWRLQKIWRHKACMAWKNLNFSFILGRYELMWASGCLAQNWIEFVWFQSSSFRPQSKKSNPKNYHHKGAPKLLSWGNKWSISLPDLRSMVSSLGRWQQTLSMVEQSNLPSFAAFVRESPWQVCEILGIWDGSFQFYKIVQNR